MIQNKGQLTPTQVTYAVFCNEQVDVTIIYLFILFYNDCMESSVGKMIVGLPGVPSREKCPSADCQGI